MFAGIKSISLRRGIMYHTTTFKEKLACFLVKLCYNPKILCENENIQSRELTEPYVIICNHTRKTNKFRVAEADGPIIRYAFLNKNVCSLAAKDIMEKFPWNFLMKDLNCIPVDRFSATTKWARDCECELKNGKSVILFPEGTTLKAQEIAEFQSGFLLLAKNAGVKVLPVVIHRTFGLFKHHRPKVLIGVPYEITGEKMTKSIRIQETERFQHIVTRMYCNLTGKTEADATKEKIHLYKKFNNN